MKYRQNHNKDFNKYVMMPGMAKKRRVIVEERMNKLNLFNETDLNQLFGVIDIGIITSGIAFSILRKPW